MDRLFITDYEDETPRSKFVSNFQWNVVRKAEAYRKNEALRARVNQLEGGAYKLQQIQTHPDSTADATGRELNNG